MKKQKKTILLVVALVLIGIVLGFALSQNSSEKALKKQLDLGFKFLTEQDYEQAIINFKKAIEIDPMSSEAYLGLADAYVGMGDLESAQSTLEDAINFFEENGKDATELRNKLAEIRADISIENGDLETAKSILEEAIIALEENGQDDITLKEKLEEIQVVIEKNEPEESAQEFDIQLWELFDSIDLYGESVYLANIDYLISKYNVQFTSNRFVYDTVGNPDFVDHMNLTYFAGPTVHVWRVDQVYDFFECLRVSDIYLFASGNSAGPVSEMSSGLTTFWRQSGCSNLVDLLKKLGLSLSDGEWNDLLNGKEMRVDTDIEDDVIMSFKSDSSVSFYGDDIYCINLDVRSRDIYGQVLSVEIIFSSDFSFEDESQTIY